MPLAERQGQGDVGAVLALQRSAGNQAVLRSVGARPALQRDMGLEIEWPIAMATSDLHLVPTEKELFRGTDVKVVADKSKRGGTVETTEGKHKARIPEFVVDHFDEHADGALTALGSRLDEIDTWIDNATGADTFAEAAKNGWTTGYPKWYLNMLAEGAEQPPLTGLVHYTLGVDLAAMDTVAATLSDEVSTTGEMARKHAQTSRLVAEEVVTGIRSKGVAHDVAIDRVQGFVELVYMNTAAVNSPAKGLMKNHTQVLSRVPLGDVLTNALSDAEQDLVKTHRGAIRWLVKRELDRLEGYRHAEVVDRDTGITVERYLDSALGVGPPISQDVVFSMTEAEVHNIGLAHAQRPGVPVELRKIKPTKMTRENWRLRAQGVMNWSRRLHGGTDAVD